MLLFKGKYREALLDGSKTTTLRSWKNRRCSAGQTVRTNLGIWLSIEEVSDLALTDIDDAIAQADGYPDASSVLASLKSIYGDSLPATLTLVRFALAPSPR
jgi:hypothetical protein